VKPEDKGKVEDPTDTYCATCDNDPCVCDDMPKQMVRIKLADNKVREIDATVKTSFWDASGTPIGYAEFMNKLYGDLPQICASEEDLRKVWSLPSTRKKLLEELSEKGYSKNHLAELQKLVKGQDCDLFDVLSYVAFHTTLVPRLERAEKAKISLQDYNPKQQQFLNFVLEQYVQQGVNELDDQKLPELLELKYQALADAKEELGDVASIRKNFIGFQKSLYEQRAS